MDQDESIKRLNEIEKRISIGFRLKEDLDWIINTLRKYLEEKK